MVNIPRTQNQERLPVQEQLKNIRSYLFQLANELQRTLEQIEAKQKKQEKRIEQLERKISEYERRQG